MLLAKNDHALLLSGSRRWYSRRTTVNRGRLPTTPAQWAAIEATTLIVFHKPGHATSRLLLKALASAIDVYPPLSLGHPSSFRALLKLKLHVELRVPTVAEFRALVDLRVPGPPTDLLREKGAHRLADPAALGAEDPAALAWPIIVDWEHKESSVGGVAYTRILEAVAEQRHKGRLSIVQDPSAPRGRRSQS
ncbi:hypothetical protein B0H17DRAFT_1332525 [Mycena rosella]|uniref:Uncharacterized protein n=1 Tax=Mycena rosella TaxID=1033263 RepID=A0AAD7DAM0_MYCRO|nr:hypothetical protein B0H17DRAFT_1332525 [Mycena rosella]